MQFWDAEPSNPQFDFDTQKRALIDNMDYIAAMSVEEQTLYKKWLELQDESMIKNKSQIAELYDIQWKPTDINNLEQTIKEIEALEPYVEIVEDDRGCTKWTYIRKMIHTMGFTANPGRNVKINVKDRTSGKLLGQISLASDVTSIAVRDNYIGWTKENKFEDGKLNHTTIASTIVCTQPLGYNFLGGKLVAMMTTVPEVREFWKEKYGQTLIGVGTTSLYGIHSQYNGIPHFKTLGESAGKISIKPDDSVYLPWNKWLKETHPDEHEKAINSTGPKQNVINKVFKHCGIKASKYHHGFKRGVYFAQMYDNGNEFLRNEISEDELVLKQKFAEGVDYINRWWKKKAIKRYTKLHSENRLKPEHLYYIDGIGTDWESFKSNYLSDVGR